MLRHLTFASAAGTLAALACTPAFAAGPVPVAPDPVVEAPVIQPRFDTDWTGPYVGGQLGWGWLDGEAGFGDGYDLEGDGFVGGLTGGYRYDFGQWVVGGELQYDWAHTDFDDVDGVDDAGSLDNIWRVKGLAGYDAGPALIYGSLGWARASVDTGGDDFDGNGWVVGAGVDYRLTDRVSLGGELMHHQFDDFEDADDLSVDATTLQGRVTFRF